MANLTLQPDAAAGFDSYMDDLNATANHGLAATLIHGHASKGGNIRRPILVYDISAIPAGSTILATSYLEIYISSFVNGGASKLHRMTTTDWEELQSTWNNYKGQVELTGGASGSVDGIKVATVEIMSGAEPFSFGPFTITLIDSFFGNARFTVSGSPLNPPFGVAGDTIAVSGTTAYNGTHTVTSIVGGNQFITTTAYSGADEFAGTVDSLDRGSLAAVAQSVALNINTFASTPNYQATHVIGTGRILIRQASVSSGVFAIVASTTTITTADTDLGVWTTAGGDFTTPTVGFTLPGAGGAFQIGASGSPGTDMAAFLQDALDTRSGIVRFLGKLDTESGGATSGFDSSDGTTASQRPKLSIDYTPPAVGGKGYPHIT